MASSQVSSQQQLFSRFLPQSNDKSASLTDQQSLDFPKHFSPHVSNNVGGQRPCHPIRPPPVPPSPNSDASPSISPIQMNKLRKTESLSPSTSTDAQSEGHSVSRSSSLFLQATPVNIEQSSMRNVTKPRRILPEANKRNKSPPKLRKSWLPRSRARLTRHPPSEVNDEPQAWINAGVARIEYDLAPLLKGEKVPELWNDAADTFIYLWPETLGPVAQMRLPYTILQSSSKLRSLIRDSQLIVREKAEVRPTLVSKETMKHTAPSSVETPPYTPDSSLSDENSVTYLSDDLFDKPRQYHLYLPLDLPNFGSQLSNDDVKKLVEVRNLFAFLTGQPLVATRTCPTNFANFVSIAALLNQYNFRSEDGNSFGTAVDLAFSFCLKEIPQIADCRESKEVTVQALILAEAMKSTELFNEAFAHAVGNYDALASLKSGSLFNEISSSTRNRLEKASRDLKQRIRSVNDRLSGFEFPSLFAGIAASSSMAESKVIRFKQWKFGFIALRKQVIAYYKKLYGQWPPKASSKKNNFIESGLNRLVLKVLYNDLCDLYDFLTDRESLTSRVYDGDGDDEPANVTPATRALRKLLDEYDRSSPPVQPPIPYDIPLVPQARNIDPSFQSMGPMDQNKRLNRKLNEIEAQLIITKSYNLDSDYKTPFIEMYKCFELKESKGKTINELTEQRYGYWIFMYACLQALPLLVTDAPGLQYTDGVEYFLCLVPLGNLPWIEFQSQTNMSWFEVQGCQQIVSLPSDLVNHGVEATYSRSHCWAAAEEWIEAKRVGTASENPVLEDYSQIYTPPPSFDPNGFGLRRSSRPQTINTDAASLCSSQRSGSIRSYPRGPSWPHQRGSIALGLEKIRIESDDCNIHDTTARGTSPTSLSHSIQGRPVSCAQSRGIESSRDFGSSTFDDILGSMRASKENMESKKQNKKETRRKK